MHNSKSVVVLSEQRETTIVFAITDENAVRIFLYRKAKKIKGKTLILA